MFFNEPGEASKWKRNVYLLASTILGILLSGIAARLMEINYLSRIANRGNVMLFNDNYATLQLLQGLLLLFGATGGFFLGRFWWRKIYIERVWIKSRKH